MTDPNLVRFGLQWKIYDMVGSKGPGFSIPILSPLGPRPQDGCWLFGGVTGTEYLVRAEGLIQPSATEGLVTSGVLMLLGPRAPLRTVRSLRPANPSGC